MNKINCKFCKSPMKKMGLSRKELSLQFWWCPKCGVFLTYEFGKKVEFKWELPELMEEN